MASHLGERKQLASERTVAPATLCHLLLTRGLSLQPSIMKVDIAVDLVMRLVLLSKFRRRIKGVYFEAQVGHLVIEIELARDPKGVCERALHRSRWCSKE